MATKPQIPKGPSNQAGLGAVPGTQQTAKLNVATGGGFNPNMPIGAQLAKQAASSYQQSLATPGTSKTGSGVTGGAFPAPTGMPGTAIKGPPGTSKPTGGTGRPIVTQGRPDPTKGYSILQGMDPQQINQMNKGMGLSNLFQATRPEEELGKTQSLLLMQQAEEEEEELGFDEGTFGQIVDQEVGQIMGVEEAAPEGYQAKEIDLGGGPPDVTSEAEEEFGFDEVDLAGLANKGPGTVDDYQGVDDDLGGSNIDEIEDAVYSWQQESEGDNIGLDPEKKQAAMDQLDLKYATFLQQTLAGLDRQAAMAGTFGSAAHTMNINSAVSNAMQQMAGEFMELEKMDLEAVEADYAEAFTQMMGVAEQFSNLEQLDMQLEGLNQAAYKMGLDKFAAEIQAYLAQGEIGSLALQEYKAEIDQLIAMGALDLEAWKAGLTKEEAEVALQQAEDALALEYEKQILASATFYGEKLAGEMTSILDFLKETYSGTELKAYYSGIMSVFSIAQQQISNGYDYDAVMAQFYNALANLMKKTNFPDN